MSQTERDVGWMHPVDESILEFLSDERTEYPAIVANRIGGHTPHVEQRCRALSERGLLEPVSGEVVYRITREGRAHVRRLDY